MIQTFISIETEPCRYLFQSSPFSSAILKPGFDLSLTELQHLGQTLSLGWGEVFLSLELLLQLDGLVVGEPHLTAFPFVQRSLEEGAPEQGLAQGVVAE